MDIYAEVFGPDGVTQRQYAVLAAAADHEGATQTDLVRITGIDRSTLADMAARMIRKGLLARERSASDARANTVRLTDLGRATLEDAKPKMAEADAKLLKLIAGGGRRTALVALLKDLLKAQASVQAPAATARNPAKPTKAAKPIKAAKPAKAAPEKRKKKAG
ncbi:MarR family winged helix-turn-helix transcriptional regulator [Phenylobacterium sp. J367]|uniref:MarR family winged helix-turn-helix transcriptional regulator n=1 Tax=Phenylobacterium sp. J367 TaxID=2898435 RepID=UPI0035AFF897